MSVATLNKPKLATQILFFTYNVHGIQELPIEYPSSNWPNIVNQFFKLFYNLSIIKNSLIIVLL
jgi:hypothetical protein